MEAPESYADKEFVPDGYPERISLVTPLKYTAGNGVAVIQTGDRVHFSLTDEVRASLARAAAALPPDDPLKYMGFRTTYLDNVVTVQPGPVSYVIYASAYGWTPVEEFTTELTTSGIPLPCYVYLQVPVKVVQNVTDTDDGTTPYDSFPSATITVDGSGYTLDIEYSTRFTTRDDAGSISLVISEVPLGPADATGDGRFLLAYLNDTGAVQQIHLGTITLPQGFSSYVNEVTVV